MKETGFLAICLTVTLLSISMPQAAQRLVLCEELYQED
jgi:hypothetical protein